MVKYGQLIVKILRGASNTNIDFEELCSLLRWLGFDERIRGSHHIFTRDNMVEMINLQPKGRFAKPYQVKQIREILITFRLGGKDE